MFLCNYARTILQATTFPDRNKILDDYKLEYFGIPETSIRNDSEDPFIVISLIDIINQSTSRSEYISVKMKEYIVKKKLRLPLCGIRLGKTKPGLELKQSLQKDNGFEFFRMNNYFNCNICEVANPTGSYPPTIFPHLTDKNSFVRIEDDVDDLLYTEHVVFIKANRKSIYDLSKVQFLFFDFA